MGFFIHSIPRHNRCSHVDLLKQIGERNPFNQCIRRQVLYTTVPLYNATRLETAIVRFIMAIC